MTATNVPRHAAVLSGGAAYAAYEVGVLIALAGGACPATGCRAIDFQILTGTSAGSFNAAILSSRPGEPSAVTATYLEDVWLRGIGDGPGRCGNGAIRYRGNLARLFNPDCYTGNPLRPFLELAEDAVYYARDLAGRAAAFAVSTQPLMRRLLGSVDLSAAISTEPYQALLRETVDLEGIRRSDKALRIAATNWRTGELKLFANEDMTNPTGYDVLLASSAFPGLPPVVIGNEPYSDGGYVLDTPLKPAVFAGGDVLHVVYLDPDISRIPIQQRQSTIDTLDRSVAIFKAAIFNRDIECAEDINRGLTLLANPESARALSEAQVKSLLRLVGRIEVHRFEGIAYRPVVVHRYNPREDLGGAVGLLNFDRDQIARLIERGFDDAVRHDCVANHCLLPDSSPEPTPRGTPP